MNDRYYTASLPALYRGYYGYVLRYRGRSMPHVMLCRCH